MKLSIATLMIVATLIVSCGGSQEKAASADSDSAGTRDSVIFTPPTVTVDSTVAWSRIVELVNDGTRNIRLVRQNHARAVSVVMKDGRVFRSTEPQFDAIAKLIKGVDQSGQTPVVSE